MGNVPKDPEQALYAVEMVRNAFDFTQSVCPLQCPKPVGSLICPPCDIGTRLPIVMVMYPPDWKVLCWELGQCWRLGNQMKYLWPKNFFVPAR